MEKAIGNLLNLSKAMLKQSLLIKVCTLAAFMVALAPVGTLASQFSLGFDQVYIAEQNVSENRCLSSGVFVSLREERPFPASRVAVNQPKVCFEKLEAMDKSPLQGCTLCVLGSSVTEGVASQGCAVGEYLAARFGCALVKESVSGTTLADNGNNSYVRRMIRNLDPNAHFDLFLCQLSTNDATFKTPLGEISNSTNLADFDTSTVTGAIEYIICYARQTWNCPVAFYTGSRYNSRAYEAMVNRLLEIKKKWGIGVLDLWSGQPFNTLDGVARKRYMADDIHPTKAGYRDWWGAEMERQLLEFFEADGKN